jgi:hypothetical protein
MNIPVIIHCLGYRPGMKSGTRLVPHPAGALFHVQDPGPVVLKMLVVDDQ